MHNPGSAYIDLPLNSPSFTIRPEHPHCTRSGSLCITFDAHPHSGRLLVSLLRAALSKEINKNIAQIPSQKLVRYNEIVVNQDRPGGCLPTYYYYGSFSRSTRASGYSSDRRPRTTEIWNILLQNSFCRHP